ncbi:thiamine pyrophosphate-dependent dehydrogenase E1 component subunit alpha [Halalkalibacterium halodurans]|uniref:Acetoin dehydrogenase E1 component (TPP-dependent alpha subunit) n=1 Tax=Halalkalibacterium halodurans (strain ATCC BAA-125 / DSM 18197 / FERM 7344 / JCM 9153 / C-125) TaxID=272558 RepID=Q9KBV2_HALH5|nr:thiamine pyrophosphate-dependent dehydrogenase E1 component subunit alpha [Halalkalibacterium halodurans]MDY7222382.1 thiamine pyrophosphate-dependent dehydrogenase E1 component subunit alpha [Halalkalibacterium halodurans]MDY7241603.1 thiamine pyrophosphate-dependent dehydrogenase E1 component subunit alpha [Halalkalibacterium halodurans]MED3648415.1 thiamine pyrophosphate-dependent dehydrogenase E1 component subunit alpha [Halalkalibacterium halodurans]MED4082311.1 thiamine pyrophosphate-d
MKTVEQTSPTMTSEKARWIYQKMVEIRMFEDRVHDIFSKGEIPGFVHLYAGEEAIAVGLCAHLDHNDYITSTHRGHGHCIAKGCELDGMMAEIYGKSTGLCKGKGGSMHIADLDRGMLGANGIVGGGFTLAAGAALTAKFKQTGGVAVCFFGDGANNQGTFHEGINLAAIWDLPVVFVAENNGYGEATPFHYASACEQITDRAKGYNIPGVKVDGKDVVAVYEVAREAVERARRGEGPTLIECITYRNYGHFEGDAQTYKTGREKEEHTEERDAITLFEKYALSNNLLTEEAIQTVRHEVEQSVDRAVDFANASDYPQPEELLTDVYVSYDHEGRNG